MPDSLLPAIQTDTVTVYLGDTVTVLPMLDASSVDSIITDPPYGSQFCDQTWDGAAGFRESLTGVDTSGMSDAEVFEVWCRSWAVGALHVLKPGGDLAAFGGTRTWHRMVRGVESAGFEIRDQIAWLYSTGMPKSMDISRAIDAHLGVVRADRVVEVSDRDGLLGRTTKVLDQGQPVTDEAKQFAGYGTGLKPGFEPILIARKPPDGTLVANVIAHGVGGLNIDAARFGDRDASLCFATRRNDDLVKLKPWENETVGLDTIPDRRARRGARAWSTSPPRAWVRTETGVRTDGRFLSVASHKVMP